MQLRSSIKNRFVKTIATMLAGFLLLLMLGTYIIEFHRSADAIDKQLHSSAESKLEQINLRLEFVKEQVEDLASNSIVVNSLIDAEGRSSYLPGLIKVFSQKKEIVSVTVFDFTGKVVESNIEDSSQSNIVSKHTENIASLTKTNIKLSPTEKSVLFVSPIKYFSSVQGGILVKVDMDELVKQLNFNSLFQYNLYMQDILISGNIDATVPGIQATHLSTSESILHGLQTSIDVSVPSRVANKDLYNWIMEIGLVGSLGIIIAIVVATRVGKALAQPILELAQKVESGVHPSGPTGTGDELEVLAESIDTKNEGLFAIKNDLELLVAERTKQLSKQAKILEQRGDELIMANRSLENANKELKALDKMKDEFISVVSHELRTPLTSIHGTLGLVVGGVLESDPQKKKELLQTAIRNSDRLSNLINDLLDYNKLMSGKLELHSTDIYVRDLVEDMIKASAGYVEKYSVQLEADYSTLNNIMIKGDRARLEQVLNNLISNAIKYSPRGEKVSIYAENMDARVRINVRDRGPGIPEEFRARIFGKFSQADSSDTRAREGTGLGLSIAKGIIEAHLGKIGYEDAPTGGTIFWMELARDGEISKKKLAS
ncbi:MAG: HAMP domain-containing histidine kinase [Gammaproteobacteria bacterium]|nr:HAMP domain-containing histidine kinase [Gammaproteobacteria bacterium]